MHVFVTGATGFVGSAIVQDLLNAGHQVLGLARSDAAAASLSAAGATVHRGALEDLGSLRDGAAASEGVIHTAFNTDFSDVAGAVETGRRAIETLGEALVGSDRPFVVTSATAVGVSSGRVATEDDLPEPEGFASLRLPLEETALSFAARGVRVCLVRLPPSVHGDADKHGFVPRLIGIARDKGLSAYPGDGSNRWAAVHQLDAARLFRLALEEAPAGARLHAVGDEGVQVRDIAEVIGAHLELPVTAISPDEASDHFGFLGPIFSLDTPASSRQTREQLDWLPVQPGLIADLDKDHYFSV